MLSSKQFTHGQVSRYFTASARSLMTTVKHRHFLVFLKFKLSDYVLPRGVNICNTMINKLAVRVLRFNFIHKDAYVGILLAALNKNWTFCVIQTMHGSL